RINPLEKPSHRISKRALSNSLNVLFGKRIHALTQNGFALKHHFLDKSQQYNNRTSMYFSWV
ncbi:hypothetical protein, partial [Acetobacter cibinongensis]|uniref:hypothetical protein n=1 Tax=Acetobacter cibinongensis TaxID=146475 RepID=UPI00196ABA92